MDRKIIGRMIQADVLEMSKKKYLKYVDDLSL